MCWVGGGDDGVDADGVGMSRYQVDKCDSRCQNLLGPGYLKLVLCAKPETSNPSTPHKPMVTTTTRLEFPGYLLQVEVGVCAFRSALQCDRLEPFCPVTPEKKNKDALCLDPRPPQRWA